MLNRFEHGRLGNFIKGDTIDIFFLLYRFFDCIFNVPGDDFALPIGIGGNIDGIGVFGLMTISLITGSLPSIGTYSISIESLMVIPVFLVG